jgi:hypothetical protein
MNHIKLTKVILTSTTYDYVKQAKNQICEYKNLVLFEKSTPINWVRNQNLNSQGSFLYFGEVKSIFFSLSVITFLKTILTKQTNKTTFLRMNTYRYKWTMV